MKNPVNNLKAVIIFKEELFVNFDYRNHRRR